MQVCVLGPVAVRGSDGVVVDVPGARVRRLLSRLVLDAPRSVSVDRLVDAVWGDDLPDNPTASLQSLVSRLRRGTGLSIEQTSGGYRLTSDDSDARVVTDIAAEIGSALGDGRPADVIEPVQRALAMWRGAPYAEMADETWAAPEIARLESVRLRLLADQQQARLDIGDGAALRELPTLVAEHPHHERLVGLLMRAYDEAGQTGDALAAYEALRQRLADAYGVDPGPALQAQHVALLRRPVVTERSAVLSHIPSSLTSFIGRDSELARARELMEQSRLVTIVGTGGAGKTRLATELAREIAESGTRVDIVELARAGSDDDVDEVVARDVGTIRTGTLSRVELPARDTRATLLDGLGGDARLIVLDNCEHVIDAAADVAHAIVTACPLVRILATSREPLAIDGESLSPLGALPVPQTGATAAEAARFASVRLFIDRARAATPDFELDDDSVADVIDVVRRLDGLPLAIELATARLRVLTLGEVARGIDDRFRVLVGGSRSAASRHRTLRAVVQWSWQLLNESEQDLMMRLSVFHGGWDRAAAAGIAGPAAEPLTDGLVDKSLLVRGGDGRYRMLETIREFALEQLAHADLGESARIRHANYFLGVARRHQIFGETGADDSYERRFAVLRTEYDNVIAALDFFIDRDLINRAAALALRLMPYWVTANQDEEFVKWANRIAAADKPAYGRLWDAVRLPHLLQRESIGFVASHPPATGAELDATEAGRLIEQFGADADPRRPGMLVIVVLGLRVHGLTERADQVVDQYLPLLTPMWRARLRAVQVTFAENDGRLAEYGDQIALALEESDGNLDTWTRSHLLGLQGLYYLTAGDLAVASELMRESSRLADRLGDNDERLISMPRLARVLIAQGRLEEAGELIARVSSLEPSGQFAGIWPTMQVSIEFEYADVTGELTDAELERWLDRVVEAGQRAERADQLRALAVSVSRAVEAHLLIRLGRDAAAIDALRESYDLARRVTDGPLRSTIASPLIDIAVRRGKWSLGAQMLGAGDRLRGGPDYTDRRRVGQVERLRESLGAGFDTAYDAGATLEVDAAWEALDPACLEEDPAT